MREKRQKTGLPAQPPTIIGQEPGSVPVIAQSQVKSSVQTSVVKQSRPVSTSISEKTQASMEEAPTGRIKISKIAILQITLTLVIILSAVILVYSLVRSSYHKSSARAGLKEADDVVEEKQAAKETKEQDKHQVKPGISKDSEANSQKEDESAEPISLQVAENYYRQKDYDQAYEVFVRLRNNLGGPDYEMTRDFLLLKMGLCLEKKEDFENANQLFKQAAMSHSVVTAVFSNYYSSLMESRLGKYLNARMRAYRAAALTGALASDYDWSSKMERDCAFIVAEAITRQAMMLCDADSQLPEKLWSQESGRNSATSAGYEKLLNELTISKSGSPEDLQKILDIGVEKLNKGLLTPQIKAVEQDNADSLSRWQVSCNGPGIDELIARFAANTHLDVRWISPDNQKIDKKNVSAGSKWNRALTLYMPSATIQQVVTTAAGAVGLIAQVNNFEKEADSSKPSDKPFSSQTINGTITITDAAEYSSLSEHTKMLAEHAIGLWRKLLLMYGDDRRMGDAHFALGILEGQMGEVAEAIAEYKLVSSRYSNTVLASFALLRSSRLKTAIRDFTGAASDLKELIEQYPDDELVSQAHLELAETTMKTGLFEQAAILYRKAYNLGYSSEFTAVAAIGAGKCYYQMKDYEAAKKWLTRYLEIIQGQKQVKNRNSQDTNFYTAYFLLGKTYLALGNFEAACSALQKTTILAVAGDDYYEALISLIETQIKMENFIGALSIIESARDRPFTQAQATQMLILRSRALRLMGLADQALAALSDRERYVADSQLKASIVVEMARCSEVNRDFDKAKELLAEGLSLLAAGPEAQAVSLELAEVCLKLGDDKQAIRICNQVIGSSQDESIKRKVADILASTYNKQQDYDKAARAILMVSRPK